MGVQLGWGITGVPHRRQCLALRGQEDQVPGLQVVEGGGTASLCCLPGLASLPSRLCWEPKARALVMSLPLFHCWQLQRGPGAGGFGHGMPGKCMSALGRPSRPLSGPAYPGLTCVRRMAALARCGWHRAIREHQWCAGYL